MHVPYCGFFGCNHSLCRRSYEPTNCPLAFWLFSDVYIIYFFKYTGKVSVEVKFFGIVVDIDVQHVNRV